MPRSMQNVWSMHVEEERDIQAGESYELQAYQGRVTIFLSNETSAQWKEGPLVEWERKAALGLKLHTVPGDHATMLAEPHIRVLAEKLKDCLEKAHTYEGEPLRPERGGCTPEWAPVAIPGR